MPVTKRYILFSLFLILRVAVNSPIIKPPTSEVFHFPTSAPVAGSNAATPKEKAPRGSGSKKAVSKAVTKAETKATTKAATKAETKPQKSKPSKVEARADVAVPKKAQGAKKEKVLRDSFTMPKSDYAKIAELKQRWQTRHERDEEPQPPKDDPRAGAHAIFKRLGGTVSGGQ